MTPAFALDLAADGIRLLYRVGGGWTVVGDASLDAADLDGRLAALRQDAEALAPDRVTTELVIPSSQIRYTEIERPIGEPVTEATLRRRLDGLTPLGPEELVFDWEIVGGVIRLAMLDRTTLDEAEAFADAHGFRPVSFSARPGPDDFPRDPDFGATSMAADFDGSAGTAPPKLSGDGGVPPPPSEPRPPDMPAAALPLTPSQRTDPQTVALARAIAAPKAAETEADSLTLFTLRGKAPLGADDRAADRRLKIAAGVGLAAMVWLAYFSIRDDGPSDPAAVLPDTPPAVALDAPGLAAPQTGDLALTTAPEATEPAALPTPAAPDVAEAARESAEGLAAGVTAPPDEMTDENPALRYAATGIWAEGPDTATAPEAAASPIDNLYIASIDPLTRSSDAIALPEATTLLAAPRPVAPLPPPPAGTTFETDENGFIVATPEGAWTPDGVVVALGPPAMVPPPAPARTADIGLPLSETAAALPDLRPRPRPGGLVERNERANLGGLSRTELARLSPSARPQSAQAAALAELDPEAPPSDFAVAVSSPPRARPAGFATSVATQRAVAAALAEAADSGAAQPEADEEPETQVASVTPRIPTSASVARQATIENAMRLRDLNLIGVYGTDGNRRALVRLPSGRYVKVQVGDRLDGGQIAAIGRSELRYVKGGRNITLSVPSG